MKICFKDEQDKKRMRYFFKYLIPQLTLLLKTKRLLKKYNGFQAHHNVKSLHSLQTQMMAASR